MSDTEPIVYEDDVVLPNNQDWVDCFADGNSVKIEKFLKNYELDSCLKNQLIVTIPKVFLKFQKLYPQRKNMLNISSIIYELLIRENIEGYDKFKKIRTSSRRKIVLKSIEGIYLNYEKLDPDKLDLIVCTVPDKYTCEWGEFTWHDANFKITHSEIYTN